MINQFLNDNMMLYDVPNFICYNKQLMANGASGVNILPAPRHVEQKQEHVPALSLA